LWPDVTTRAKEAIKRAADRALTQVETTSLRIGQLDEYAYPGYSGQVNPRGLYYLIYAYEFLRDPKYLAGALKGNGFQLGINPNNTVFTSGVGKNPTLRPFMVDPRISSQKFPPGITVYGPLFFEKEKDTPWFKLAAPFMYPKGEAWPASETWFDGFWTIMMNEFTIMQSMGPTTFTWGYFAFRK
jgi:endoglucanase